MTKKAASKKKAEAQTDGPEQQASAPTVPTIKITLHWDAHRRVRGRKKDARLKATLSIPADAAAAVRAGRLAAVSNLLAEREAKALGGAAEWRTFRRCDG